SNLNELEVVGNTLYANLWGSDSIAVIDLKNGKVTSWIDFSIQAKKVRAKNSKAEVLNGIAYDGKDFWITGKYWPVMYKIRLKK
ncbi:MAG: glutaminyl-peptide cyclotransferase, partial [Fibrobacteraceae bacterium]